MFYLMMHSTHFIYGYMFQHMVKDHSDSERGNLLLPQRLLFPISSKGSFICIIPDRITHTMAFVTPVVEHWLEREIAQWVHHEGSIRRPIITMSERSYHRATSRSLHSKLDKKQTWLKKRMLFKRRQYNIQNFDKTSSKMCILCCLTK